MLTLLKCHRHKLSSFYRLLDRYQKPITALAIFTDDKMDYRPQRYDYQCIVTTVTYTFNTYKVIEQDESTLSMHPNPFALVVLTVLKAIQNKNSSDLSLLSLKIDLFKRMYNRKIEKPTMRAMANFLKMYVHFSEPESNRIFKNEIQSITNNNTTMGIEEVILHREKQKGIEQGIELGIEKGAERKSEKVVRNLISKLGLSDEQAADIARVDVAFVVRVRNEMGL